MTWVGGWRCGLGGCVEVWRGCTWVGGGTSDIGVIGRVRRVRTEEPVNVHW